MVAAMAAVLGLGPALGGCHVDGSPTPAPVPTATSTSPVGTRAAVSTDPDAAIVQAHVTREGGRLDVTALWVLAGRSANRRELVVRTAEGTTRVPHPGEGELRRAFPAVSPTTGQGASSVLGRLLALPVPSLRPGTRAVIGGGDGATQLPFEKVARSVPDYWSVQPLPRFGGAMAYIGGGVVLSDGRLLVLLDHFSDDRGGKPAGRHHGLWVSRGDDWLAYRSLRPAFDPPVAEREDGWTEVYSLGASADPDPVIWVTTWDHRLYVSTDDARSFREIPAR